MSRVQTTGVKNKNTTIHSVKAKIEYKRQKIGQESFPFRSEKQVLIMRHVSDGPIMLLSKMEVGWAA